MDTKELYNSLRRELSTYDAYSVIKGSLDLLYEIDYNKDFMPFWHTITLIKWSIINCSSSSLILLKQINREGLVKFLQKISRIEDQYHKEELAKEDINLFTQIHTINNQQFPYQRDVDKFTFPRQSILYKKIKIRKSKLERQFSEITKLEIPQFIESLVILFFSIYPENYRLSTKYYGEIDDLFKNTITTKFGLEKNKNLLELITLNITNLESSRLTLKEISRITNPIYHLFDQYSFSSRPIIEIDNKLRIIHRKLLNITFRYFIYDKLKTKFKEQFTSEFGERIEKYIKMGLDEADLDYYNENQLKNIIKDESKVVDYLVEGKVIIECKGIEMHPLPRVVPNRQNLSRYLKGSILKALTKQVINIKNKFNLVKEDTYVIIITYKELNLGFGKDILKTIISDDEVLNQISQNLESERIFILDLEEWDILISYVKHENLPLNMILDEVVKEEKKNRKKFVSMHLVKIFGSKETNLDYLNNEFDEMMSGIGHSM